MSDISKTINYIKRNGLSKTFSAVSERIREKMNDHYAYTPISEEERLDQISKGLTEKEITFSILVPVYETPEKFLREMTESVISQTYPSWELIVADSSSTDNVKKVMETYKEPRIRYIRLNENKGISGNSNEALKYCTGEYTALLDHDDVLTVDALFKMAENIRKYRENGIKLHMLYSDEDKTDAETSRFFDANIKPDFNLDLLLSNNYICHLLVLLTEDIKALNFRSEYDGAQDHDLILREVSHLKHEFPNNGNEAYDKYIKHIGKVLYHWRCHSASTAANPGSKAYAYDAGKRAVSDFLSRENIKATVSELPHVGFFRVNYENDIFAERPEIGAVGYRILDKNGRVKDGVMDENGDVMFLNLKRNDSGGSLHRAACQMLVPYVSVLGMLPNHEGSKLLRELLNGGEFRDESGETDYHALSIRFCDIMKERGFKFLYDPETVIEGK